MFMKKTNFSLLLLAIVVICTSCAKEPLPMVYLVNQTDESIMLYSETDSMLVMPQKKSLLATWNLYKSDQIASWSDCSLGSNPKLMKAKISGKVFDVPKIYREVLNNVSNYRHYKVIDSYNSGYKYMAHYYEYYLTTEWIETVISTQ